MNKPGPFPILAGLSAGLFFFLAGLMASAELEPQWLRLQIPQMSLGTEVEGLTEDVTINGSSSSHDQISVVPLVGLRTRGSIYHPKLITFDLNGEAGWGWMSDDVKSTGDDYTRNERHELLRYLAQVNFLSGKPYNASFFASQDHTYRNYESFSTYTVDTTRYGGRINWTTDTLSLNTDVGHREETSDGLTDSSELAETYLNFYVSHKRDRGRTSVTYRYNEFDNTLNAGDTQNSVNHSVGITDSETFGSRDQVTVTTGGSYSQYDYSGEQTKTYTADESITYNHHPNLDSLMYANYSHSSLESATSSLLQGEYQIRHQLYDSLTSALDVHGSHDENSSDSGSADYSRYGVGLSEDYTKRLWACGRLSIRGGIAVNHEDYRSSGSQVTTIGEQHTLYLPTDPRYRPALGTLNKPDVITSTILVLGPRGPATRGVDYMAVPSGQLTEIRLIQTNQTVLQNGDTVLVNYDSESSGDASFESFSGNAEIRLDLFGKFGVYVRVNWLDNNAPPQTVTETLTDLVGGADFSWRGLRAGAEYEDYDSNFTQYQAWRFFEGYNFQPTEGSLLSVDFSQTFYHYPDNQDQTQYQFITRLNTQLTYSLAWYLEGGYTMQDVWETEQDFGSARTGLTWAKDKLNIRTGYQYNYLTTTTGQSTERRERNYFYAYLKRYF